MGNGKFSIEQLSASKTFPYAPDLVQAVLAEGIYYSKKEAEQKIELYLGRKEGEVE